MAELGTRVGRTRSSRCDGSTSPFFAPTVSGNRAKGRAESSHGIGRIAGFSAFWSGNWSSRTTFRSDLCTWMRPL